MKRAFLASFLTLSVACSSKSSSSTPSSHPPIVTTLTCPAPGPLPFTLSSQGFQNAANDGIDADGGAIVKDEATDTLGNPNGSSANVFLDEDAGPSQGIASYQGVKARATTNGLVSTPIPGELVSLWYFDPTAQDWTMLGRTTTDAHGNYTIPATTAPALNTPAYAVLEADGTCATHYDDLLPSGSKVVVFDIDGTLTTDDGQLVTELFNESYMPAMMADANGLVQAWAAKKYTVIYLTARSDLFRPETRLWLNYLKFPVGVVITGAAGLTGAAAEAYKATWLGRMVTDFGWTVVAAYGNEDTDIEAYQAVSIPNDRIFIVGPSGGDLGSTAILGNDFTSHVTQFVGAQPDND